MPMKQQIKWHAESIPRGKDEVAGADVVQLTSAPVISHDIYGEQIYAASDGSRLAFMRSFFPDVHRRPEVWVCDLTTRRTARMGECISEFVVTTPFLDTVYYVRPPDKEEHRLVRLNLKTLEQEDVFAFRDCPLPIVGTISPDERYFVAGLRVQGTRYGLYRVDLSQGMWEVFHEHEDIFNPHVQFEPSEGRDLLVQLNCGGIVDEDGNIVRLIGEEGATLYVVDRDGNNERPLPVGKPHTSPVTGHECWIGRSQRVLLTAADSVIYAATPGDERATVVAKGLRFNHISASSDGRFFIADDWNNGRLYIGDLATNRFLPICESHASCGRPQYSHSHPYVTPDNRHVIFNSDCTGICQVYAAVIPEGFLEMLRD